MALHLIRRARLLAVTGLIAASLAAPLAASAAEGPPDGGTGPYSNGATIEVVSVKFESKLLVTVTLKVTCEPFFEYSWDGTPTGNTMTQGRIGGNVWLQQAQGRAIANASGSLPIDPYSQHGTPVTCDGSASTFPVSVVAEDLPLKRGDALVHATVSMSPDVGWTGNYWSFDNAGSGPVIARIR